MAANNRFDAFTGSLTDRRSRHASLKAAAAGFGITIAEVTRQGVSAQDADAPASLSSAVRNLTIAF